jgi:hypothetical protein
VGSAIAGKRLGGIRDTGWSARPSTLYHDVDLISAYGRQRPVSAVPLMSIIASIIDVVPTEVVRSEEPPKRRMSWIFILSAAKLKSAWLLA